MTPVLKLECTKKDAEKFIQKCVKGALVNKVKSDALRLLFSFYNREKKRVEKKQKNSRQGE